MTLVACHARSRIAGLVFGDLSALAQYPGKVPPHAALGRLLDTCRQGGISARTKHHRIDDRARCAENSDLHAQANPSGHSGLMMEEPLL